MRAAIATLVLACIAAAPAAGALRCGDDPGDDTDLLVIRLIVSVSCDCNGSRSAFMACARDRIATAVAGGNLRAECARDARRCAARSTCGRPGKVTCCKTVRGASRCKIRKTAAACTGSGGTVGACPSCCDACSGGCFMTTTTTTTLPGACGGSVPTCGGACPAGEVCARDDDIEVPEIGCKCFPIGATPCMQAGFPVCGGACLGGEVCQAVNLAGVVNFSGCFCVPPASTCGPFPGPCMSLGRCPAGQICSAFSAGGTAECGCVTTTTAPTTTTSTTLPGVGCMSSAFPACGGICPVGFSCQAFQTTGDSLGAGCDCVVTGSTCATPPGGGCTTGQCPPGNICTAFIVGGMVIDCGCGP